MLAQGVRFDCDGFRFYGGRLLLFCLLFFGGGAGWGLVCVCVCGGGGGGGRSFVFKMWLCCFGFFVDGVLKWARP